MNLNFYKSLSTFSHGKEASKFIMLLIAVAFSNFLFAQTAPNAPTNVTANPSAFCVGSSSNLRAVSAGNQIKWYTDPTGGSYIGTSNSGANFSVSPTVAKTYYAESYSPSTALSSATRTSVSVTVNTPPVITSTPENVSQGNASGQCGTSVNYPEVSATGTPTPAVVYSNPPGSDFGVGTTTVLTTAINTCGSSSLSFDVTVVDNEVPFLLSPPDKTVNAPSGSTTASNVDLGAPVVSDNCGIGELRNDAPAAFPGGNTTVTWTATDYHGHTVTASQTITVVISNLAPAITGLATSSVGNIMAAGSTTTLNITWNDENGGGPYSVDFDWNDGSVHTVLNNVSGNSASASHAYSASGVFEPTVKVTDGGGLSSQTTFQYLAVFVTGNQFTTGGGWFNAPASTLASNPYFTGKINIGNNCKPKNGGGFQGEMELNCQGGNFKFKSGNPFNWDYLVVSGCYLAIFKGSGTVNGTGNYGILVAQTDKDRNPANANKIRIKIWDKNNGNAVVFDTQPGADDNDLPTMPVQQGTIKVHVQNDCAARLDDSGMPIEGMDANIYPNPFGAEMTFDIRTVSTDNVSAEIFDVVGKLVQRVTEIPANVPFTVHNDLPAGVYFIHITQGETSLMLKMAKN